MDDRHVLQFLQLNLEDVNSAMTDVVEGDTPTQLYEPARYILASSGKRFRAQLVLAASSVFVGSREVALKAAVAVEVFHLFTLVHDDIMDQSDSRRGIATIHARWDEPTAILTGDFLLGRASEILLAYPDDRLRSVLGRFSNTVRILCEGQIRDMSFEQRDDVSLEDYLQMIDQKTSALMQTALVLGAMTGSADTSDFVQLDLIGHHLGRAFQIQDDLLDLVADSSEWGKPIGGDLTSGKRSFLLLKALELERISGDCYFHEIQNSGGLDSSQLKEARLKLDALGVTESARSSVILHSQEALDGINSLPSGTGRDALIALTGKMQRRLY